MGRQLATDEVDPELSGRKLLLEVNEACARLGISRDRLYAEVKAGRLKSSRSGGRRYFTARQLEEFVELLERDSADRAVADEMPVAPPPASLPKRSRARSRKQSSRNSA